MKLNQPIPLLAAVLFLAACGNQSDAGGSEEDKAAVLTAANPWLAQTA